MVFRDLSVLKSDFWIWLLVGCVFVFGILSFVFFVFFVMIFVICL